jgi:hypothetical protein
MLSRAVVEEAAHHNRAMAAGAYALGSGENRGDTHLHRATDGSRRAQPSAISSKIMGNVLVMFQLG